MSDYTFFHCSFGLFLRDEGTPEEGVSEYPHLLSEDLVTLSTLPKSRWYNLQQLDIIKQHNKPKQPPKQPKKAPFFLPPQQDCSPSSRPLRMTSWRVWGGGVKDILNLGGLVPLSDFKKTSAVQRRRDRCKCGHSFCGCGYARVWAWLVWV